MSEEKTYDIKIRSYHFSKSINNFISSLKFERLYFSIFDQLLRGATSIGANVVEGKAGSSRKDFKNFYNIALKSANETKYWLCLIRDTDVAQTNKEKVNELLKEADEISKNLASIIINLNKDRA
ncbi:four helix bundle protein [Pedobacter sp. Leaf250]|uniref:four helix bundle protein n=1 Tax=Pedobacter sp. Leaf250 TaxID=2876559 RepID=UPI001E447FC8|nr:four helix bundle protein [Pedobacter sp. Leaf250]